MKGIQRRLVTLSTLGTLLAGTVCSNTTEPSRSDGNNNSNAGYTLDTKIRKFELVNRGAGRYYLDVIVEGTPPDKIDKFLVYIDDEKDRHAFGGADYKIDNGVASAKKFIHCETVEYPYFQGETASCPGTHTFVIAAYNIMKLDKTPAKRTYTIP